MTKFVLVFCKICKKNIKTIDSKGITCKIKNQISEKKNIFWVMCPASIEPIMIYLDKK